MTETSFYFDGTITGDASLAPYTAALYTTNWKKIFTRVDDEGIISEYENELEVSGISGGVIVDTGAALVEGYFYENTAQVTVTIPTPSSDPRIDRIVLQKDVVTQTVRIFRLAGTENAAPTAPTLTQTAGGTWEIPIAQVLITTGGVITVTDNRDYPWTPLIPAGIGIIEIETIESDGALSNMDFQDIPQIHKHLYLIGSVRGNIPSHFRVYFNGDTTTTNYWRQVLSADDPNAQAATFNSATFIATRGASFLTNEPVGFNIEILHYISAFYKNVIQTEALVGAGLSGGISSEGSIWLNTDAIERVTLQLSGGILESGSSVTLYATD